MPLQSSSKCLQPPCLQWCLLGRCVWLLLVNMRCSNVCARTSAGRMSSALSDDLRSSRSSASAAFLRTIGRIELLVSSCATSAVSRLAISDPPTACGHRTA